MRGLIDRVAKFFGWLDAIEFVVPAVLAVLLLVGGPFLAIFFLFRNHHLLAAGASASLWLLACLACVRDLRRQHLTLASSSLIALWLILTIVIGWRLETM
jgi:hypothetical protein